jgi:hypothetical protein
MSCIWNFSGGFANSKAENAIKEKSVDNVWKNHIGSEYRWLHPATKSTSKEQPSILFSHRNCTVLPVAATWWQIYAPVRPKK